MIIKHCNWVELRYTLRRLSRRIPICALFADDRTEWKTEINYQFVTYNREMKDIKRLEADPGFKQVGTHQQGIPVIMTKLMGYGIQTPINQLHERIGICWSITIIRLKF